MSIIGVVQEEGLILGEIFGRKKNFNFLIQVMENVFQH